MVTTLLSVIVICMLFIPLSLSQNCQSVPGFTSRSNANCLDNAVYCYNECDTFEKCKAKFNRDRVGSFQFGTGSYCKLYNAATCSSFGAGTSCYYYPTPQKCAPLEHIPGGTVAGRGENNPCSGTARQECEYTCSLAENFMRDIGRPVVTCQNDGSWSKNPPDLCYNDEHRYQPTAIGQNCKGGTIQKCKSNVCNTVKRCAELCDINNRCTGFAFVYDPTKASYLGGSCHIKDSSCKIGPSSNTDLIYFQKESTTKTTTTLPTTPPTISRTTLPSSIGTNLPIYPTPPNSQSTTTTPWYSTTDPNKSRTGDPSGSAGKDGDSKGDLPIVLIIALAAAVLLFVIVFVIALIVITRVRRKRKEKSRQHNGYYTNGSTTHSLDEEGANHIDKSSISNPVIHANLGFDDAEPDEYNTTIGAITGEDLH